jgi:hypothetical protein
MFARVLFCLVKVSVKEKEKMMMTEYGLPKL